MFGAVRRGQLLARSLRTSSLARPAVLSSAVKSPLCVAQTSAAVASLSRKTFATSSTQWAFAKQMRRPGRDPRDPRAPRAPREPAQELKADDIDTENQVTKFQDLVDKGLVSSKVIDVITQDMGLETLTDVQRQTINATLDGTDVLAQAKTGTGKTLGFLIPVIQRIMLKDPSLEGRRGLWNADHGDIRAVIISPTRELAEQIAVEARKVVSKTGIVVQTAVGGNHKREALNKMQREGCHILIGTPGRLIDIFSDPRTNVSAPKLQCLVLDEADRLLDDGFAPDIAELQRHFPKRESDDRQTLMFSATVPREVTRMVRSTMKPDFKFVKTVDDNEVPTHLAVPQKMVFLKGIENEMPALIELFNNAIREHKADPENVRPFKPIVYYNSTAEVRLAMDAYRNIVDAAFRESPRPENIPMLECTEMHSRLSQQARTRNSNFFRNSTSCVLFSSDVTARGMDFPNVTHVIQVGIPRDRETYIHRLGRTARANKKGEGWLFVHDVEFDDLRNKLRKLPLDEDTSVKMAELDLSRPGSAGEETAELLKKIKAGYELLPLQDKYDAFRAYFGVYGSTNKRKLVQMINSLTTDGWGLEEPLMLSPTLASRLGLRNVPGVTIGEQYIPPAPRRDDGDRYGSGNTNRRSTSRGGDRGSGGRFGGDRGSGGRFGGDRSSGGRFGGDRSSGGRFGGDRSSGGRFGGDRGSGGRFGGDRGQGFAQRNTGSPFDKFKDRSSLNEFQERNPVHKVRANYGRDDFKKPNRQAPWMGRGARS